MEDFTWWRYCMETFAALLAFCNRNPPVTGGFLHKGTVIPSFIDVRNAWLKGEFSSQKPAMQSIVMFFISYIDYTLHMHRSAYIIVKLADVLARKRTHHWLACDYIANLSMLYPLLTIKYLLCRDSVKLCFPLMESNNVWSEYSVISILLMNHYHKPRRRL